MGVPFLGWGTMGHARATNLAKADQEPMVWNRPPGKQVEGAQTAATPAEAAAGAEVVWMCVSDTAAVEQLLFGENGVEASLQPGMFVVDSSTIAPSATRAFAERVRARGADYVDAPVTGSKIGAQAGQLIFIVGGSEQAVEHLRPLFNAMGKTVLRMGDVSRGQSARLSADLMIALIYEGFAEVLT